MSRGRTLSNLIAANEGASAVEYALALAMIVGGILVTTELVGIGASRVFKQTATTIAHPAVPATGDAAPQPELLAAVSAPVNVSEGGLSITSISLMLGVAVICGYALAFGRSRSKNQPQETEVEEKDLCEVSDSALFAKRQLIRQRLLNHADVFITGQIVARHIMSTDPFVVAPNTTLEEIDNELKTRHIGHVLVCGAGGELLGMVTKRQIATVKNLKSVRAQDIMSPAQSVEFTTPLSNVITMAIKRKAKSFAVLRDGKLQGIITATDVMMTLQCALQILPAIGNSPHFETFLQVFTGEEEAAGKPISPQAMSNQAVSSQAISSK